MQTFLPIADFTKSAQVIDNQRLRKQLIESVQIHQTITGQSNGWKNHPAVKQYVGFAEFLYNYGVAINVECNNRGFQNSAYFDVPFEVFEIPWWFGLDEYHNSHKSKLLWKGRVDAVCYSLRSHLKVRSINEWLKQNGFSQKNVLTRAEVFELEDFAKSQSVKISENHYAQFGWVVRDDLPYFWPSKCL